MENTKEISKNLETINNVISHNRRYCSMHVYSCTYYRMGSPFCISNYRTRDPMVDTNLHLRVRPTYSE